MLQQNAQGSEACAELELRLELQHRQSLQLRAELEAERAERHWQGSYPLQLHSRDSIGMNSQVHPTRDLGDVGLAVPGFGTSKGSKIKQALIGEASSEPGCDMRYPAASCSVNVVNAVTSAQPYSAAEEIVETIPLLPPPKVISVAGDAEDSSLNMSRHSGSPIASGSTSIAPKQAGALHDQSMKTRVHYLDASLDMQAEREQMGPVHDRAHDEHYMYSVANVSRSDIVQREPLVCPRVLPVPSTADCGPQGQVVMRALPLRTTSHANALQKDCDISWLLQVPLLQVSLHGFDNASYS